MNLKTCPCCDGPAKSHSSQVAEDVTETWVACEACGLSTDRVEGAYSEHETAVALWNRRDGVRATAK